MAVIEKCDLHIHEALFLAKQLTLLADGGDQDSQDDGCSVLYGVIRDCAYKIRTEAERERSAHQARGVWSIPVAGADLKVGAGQGANQR
jgi:hypothetical protein